MYFGKIISRGLRTNSRLLNDVYKMQEGRAGWSVKTRGAFDFVNKNMMPKNRLFSSKVSEETGAGVDDEYYIDVSNIEARWVSMNFEGQQDIISYLNVKQEFGWEYLSKDEKRAIYYIAYGNWGPRDAKIMSTAEFVFKLMTNMLLFSVLGFSLMNYAIDQEKIATLEQEKEAHDAGVDGKEE